ncbi:MAG: hypothetical protein H6751_07490 [Candidatus Omnitrophica bacterium]|nr:hypothetical protein [Candidatus Omnitrophota bacterium]MCB9782792.1 hypothetical protein [Candidatus Omnitrophota bacterium]
MNPSNNSSRKDKGMALLMALFLTLLAGLLVTPILDRAVFHHNDAFREQRYITALHLAEAGIEDGIWHLSYDKEDEWTGWDVSNDEVYEKNRSTFYDTSGNAVGEFEIEILNPIPLGTQIDIGPLGSALPFPIISNSEPTIIATAGIPDIETVGSEVRVIEVEAKARTVFSLGLFSDEDLELGGTTVVDSFDSRDGFYGVGGNIYSNGDAGSNHDILLNGTPIIDGDASAGGSVVLVGNNAEITGEVEGGMTKIDLPPVNTLVDAAKLENDNADIPQAVKSNGQLVDAFNPSTGELNVVSGATLTLPGGTQDNPKVYYLSSSNLGGNSNLIVDGHVVIFTDGNLDWNGGTVVNNGGSGPPERLMIYSSGTLDTDITINGGAGYAGVIYAPDAHITLTGGGDIYGAAVGGKVDVSGNGEFHYDEALGDVGLIAFFEVNEWNEKPRPWETASTSETSPTWQ